MAGKACSEEHDYERRASDLGLNSKHTDFKSVSLGDAFLLPSVNRVRSSGIHADVKVWRGMGQCAHRDNVYTCFCQPPHSL